MIYGNVGVITDPLKQNLTLAFRRKKQTKTETHINHDQIHHQIHIRNWLGPIIFSPGDSHKKGLFVQLDPGLEGTTPVDTDPEEGFVSFKVTPLPLTT